VLFISLFYICDERVMGHSMHDVWLFILLW